MYSETQTSGVKEFFAAVAAAAVLMILSRILLYIIKTTNLAANITVIALFVVLGYIVYTHYAAVFEYKTDGSTLTVTRKIGHKVKTEQIKRSEIKSISHTRPRGVRVRGFCTAVLFPKNPIYITCGEKAVLIDGSDELYEKVKSMSGGKK